MAYTQKSGPVDPSAAGVPPFALCPIAGIGRAPSCEREGAAWCEHAGNSQARWARTEERLGRSPSAKVSRPEQGQVGADQALPSSDGSSRLMDCNHRRIATPELQCAQAGWNPAALSLSISISGAPGQPGAEALVVGRFVCTGEQASEVVEAVLVLGQRRYSAPAKRPCEESELPAADRLSCIAFVGGVERATRAWASPPLAAQPSRCRPLDFSKEA